MIQTNQLGLNTTQLQQQFQLEQEFLYQARAIFYQKPQMRILTLETKPIIFTSARTRFIRKNQILILANQIMTIFAKAVGATPPARPSWRTDKAATKPAIAHPDNARDRFALRLAPLQLTAEQVVFITALLMALSPPTASAGWTETWAPQQWPQHIIHPPLRMVTYISGAD